MAYGRLGIMYSNLGETARAAQNTRRAYELRGRVSEQEKFYIDSHFEQLVIGDLEAARKSYELWAETYLHDSIPPNNLSGIYSILGEYGRALTSKQKALKLDPGSRIAYTSLVGIYLHLNRLDEAKATAQEARANNLDSPFIHSALYLVDFLQVDVAEMEREAAGLMGRPGYEDLMLSTESDTTAYAGQLLKARELTRRAADSARRADEKETAAGYEAQAALREVLVGNKGFAKERAQAALALSDGRDVEASSAIALGLAGDSAQARRLAIGLSERLPEDTIVQSEYLPMIQAAIVLGSGKASREANKAIEALTAAAPYELGTTLGTWNYALFPAYLRGEAYLAVHQGAAAAVEFQKILDHSGIVVNKAIGALARLGLGRAYVVEASLSRHGENGGVKPPLHRAALAKARSAYQDFFALWKDADPDIPILQQAKAEYQKLK